MALVKRFFSEIGRALRFVALSRAESCKRRLKACLLPPLSPYLFRETGSAVDRAGLGLLDNAIFKEPFSRHRSIMNLYDKHPVVSPDAFVAPNATVVGRVDVNKCSSVWYGAVVRGECPAPALGFASGVLSLRCFRRRPEQCFDWRLQLDRRSSRRDDDEER